MPEISILMGVYNGAKYLDSSISSIINQSFKDWELIICDDCSQDDTWEIITDYSKKDERIVCIRNEKNMKLPFCLNRCFSLAKGRYIARMDDDDISLPERLKKEFDYLEQHPNCSCVGSNVLMFNSTKEIGIKKYPEYVDIKVNKYKIVQFAHPTIMIRRNVFEELGGYCEKKFAERGEDFELWSRFFEKGFVGHNIQEPLLKYRMGEKGYKKERFRIACLSVKRHFVCYKRLHFPLYKYLKAFHPLLVYFIPMSLMAKWHEKKSKRNDK